MPMHNNVFAAVLLRLIAAYRYLLSPWVGNNCRYWPTCSEYAREAIEQHGAARGSYLAARRLARCHPYGRGGVDPVPAAFAWRCTCRAEARGGDVTAGTASDA